MQFCHVLNPAGKDLANSCVEQNNILQNKFIVQKKGLIYHEFYQHFVDNMLLTVLGLKAVGLIDFFFFFLFSSPVSLTQLMQHYIC